MSNFLAGLITGFGVCAFLTNKLLLKKARNNEYPVTDDSNDLYCRKDDEASR